MHRLERTISQLWLIWAGGEAEVSKKNTKHAIRRVWILWRDGAVNDDARQATVACLVTWRGGGSVKNTCRAFTGPSGCLENEVGWWGMGNKSFSFLGPKKRLEPL